MTAQRKFVKRFTGVFGFPITPLKKDLSVDLDGMAKLADWMTKYPFCAQVTTGGTGEMYSLSPEENVEVIRVSVEATKGRMPVVAGIGFNAPIAVSTARAAEKAGAAALLVMPPYYTNAPFDGLLAYYEAVGKATDLPIALYSRDWAAFTPDQVARLCDRIPTLVFWKDGQGDARTYQRIISQVGDRLAWIGGIGDDCASAYFAVGVQAYTSSISNVAPKLSLAIAEAGMKRNFAKLDQLMRRYVHPLYALRDRSRGYEVAVMKKMMELRGLPAGPVRPPLVDVKASEEAEIKALVKLYGPWK
jgi:5-dehydro-4-deoxyglucarate dehydratase